MTTRPPSTIQYFSEDSLEKIAYTSVGTIPAREPNDLARLGYHVWQFLTGKIPTLEEAVHIARARVLITEPEVNTIIAQKLKELGIQEVA